MQQGWGQQYKDDQPAWARSFEPPAMCSSQTSRAINILIELYLVTGNATYLDPIPDAIDWLESCDITWMEEGEQEEGWARLYELQTNVPIFGIAEGGEGESPEYVYTFEEARTGYSWRGDYHINKTIDNYEQLEALGFNIEDFIEWRETPKDWNDLEDDAKDAIEELSVDYYWLDDGEIEDSEFAGQADDIIEYLRKN
ncbi:MAG: hypothetical protein GF364_06615 [Candidatus Lokiarchaeota archaeon]|nr:hypothetical protein [Candidatus Lokiarchaeota archaeon]